jgi:hypothetical protein
MYVLPCWAHTPASRGTSDIDVALNDNQVLSFKSQGTGSPRSYPADLGYVSGAGCMLATPGHPSD